ncbi:hypothetical protein [Stigmatella aurantiaca]|uniref:Conserved uncharacterized protein n=2 Tax=Stigmatella aurantiaca (strain DW4/3-1) TaxID=378806 RepID=E3FH77_STIAD|nr:hypothetical protein [Stigmatella aurantiaca]ADO75293.1 conserved uncharacterized protein [Stigmatella aurantiaca DW4/3-1]
MDNPSPEKLKAAVQALAHVRAVEGPPGDNGHRPVWHMSAQGVELLSLVDPEGRVQRQEMTLLDDHYVWSSGEGLLTGWVERGASARVNPAAATIRTDPQLLPFRLVRGARALAGYEGEDRYILHMKRVLALAREGLELRGEPLVPLRPQEPEEATVTVVPSASPPSAHTWTPPSSSRFEGLMMVGVLGVGLIVGIALLFWLL